LRTRSFICISSCHQLLSSNPFSFVNRELLLIRSSGTTTCNTFCFSISSCWWAAWRSTWRSTRWSSATRTRLSSGSYPRFSSYRTTIFWWSSSSFSFGFTSILLLV